jgi:hypothetical protein
MRQPPAYTTWKITCQSREDADRLQQWLASRIDLDRVITDTIRVTPNGVEQVQAVRHRLGDYFADICVLPDSLASFRLVFHRQSDAGRYWKDLMVCVLQEVEGNPMKAKVELDSKGETHPAVFAGRQS